MRVYEDINEIEKKLYQDETKLLNDSEIKQSENEEYCGICLESSINEAIRLRCIHIFCYKCITKWFEENLTCPTCRKVVSCEEETNLKLL